MKDPKNLLDFNLYIIKATDSDNDMLEYEVGNLTHAREIINTLQNSTIDTFKIALYGYSKGSYYNIIL